MIFHTTADEICFLRKLGQHTKTGKTRLELLKSYQETMYMRHSWGQVNQNAVARVVQAMIQQEQRGQQ